jgi:WhiB family redox-sensing transcriptional regulator
LPRIIFSASKSTQISINLPKYIIFVRKYAALGLDLIEFHAWKSLMNPACFGRPKVGRRTRRSDQRPGAPVSVAIEGVINSDGIELSWQERALCAQTDPEAFFPEKGGSTREAKRVCLSCDVRGECLEYALAHDERFGIWGGLSERERRRLKRRSA